MSHHKSKKIRKESGRRYNKFYDPENGWYYIIYWNDWIDHRDGARMLGGYDRTRTSKAKQRSKQKKHSPILQAWNRFIEDSKLFF